jgi:rfaE bifunctional protein kinase chain/domain
MKDSALRDLVAALAGKRILIAGDVMLDEYIWGDVRRISPEAPVPIVEYRRRTYRPGGAANTAVNITALRGQALLAGVVGDDPLAERLAETLRQEGVTQQALLTDPERPTTTKTRIIAHNQQVVRLDCEQRASLPAALEDALLHWAEQHVSQVDACILCDYAKGVVSARFAQHFIGLARQQGKPVVVDPKGADFARYRGATVLKPNAHEAGLCLRRDITGEAALQEVGRELTRLLPGSALLITRGAEGMALFQDGSPPVHIPTVARAVFDVTGAGDTVVGTLTLALAAGAPLVEAARLANQAAGIVVGKVGTTTVTPDELLGSLGGESCRS